MVDKKYETAKKEAEKQLSKNIRQRAGLWAVWLLSIFAVILSSIKSNINKLIIIIIFSIGFIVVDEYLKQGYFFHAYEIIYMTHEAVVLVLLVVLIVALLIKFAPKIVRRW